ncbi:MAG TPA: amino acid permease [Vicinamibacterales bacterium]|nr:amino acid permease [Vicinamibacterales bacterium]
MSTSAPHLVRRLGVWASTGIVVGITIGSGIFRTPASVAAHVTDPRLMLSVWVLGGALALCGALSFAELAATFPQSGGLYVFLREGWGRPAGFLFGWSELVLIRASAGGALATVFADYFLRSAGIEPGGYTTRVVAALALIVAAAINIRGIRLGAIVTGVSTIGKFGALACLVFAAFVFGGRSGGSTAHFTTTGSTVESASFGLALISVLWAYDGFADLSFAGGEVRHPQRTLPRAIVLGTIAIVAIYLLVNAAYLFVTPVDAIARSPLIAADTIAALFGDGAVEAVSVVVAVSTFGALVGTMLAPPRIFFAMADDGLFFRSVARVHPRYHTPHIAILIAVTLGILFVLTRTFDQLADTFVLTIWPFYALAIAGLYRLRRSRPELPRPYRVPGFPIVPAVFIAAAVYLVANAVVADPIWTGVTFGIVLAGIPAYLTIRGSDTSQRAATTVTTNRRRPRR